MDRKHWRNQVVEQAIDPDLPIVDAHHHIWSEPPVDWLEVYDENALFADMSTSGHNIVGTVMVDSHANYRDDGPPHLSAVGETENADRIARQAQAGGGRISGACSAIVSNADLTLGERVAEILDAHMAASPRFRGIRHMTAYDASLGPIYGAAEEGLLGRRELRAGLAELQRRGLSFDAWVFHHQLSEVVALARATPATSIIVNHLGGPLGVGRYANQRGKPPADWLPALYELATCENVFLKIGGLNQPFTGLANPDRDRPPTSEELAAQQREFILPAIDAFGPTRCMFESNFPADMVYTSYTVIWNGFKRVTEAFSSSERGDLFSGTACRAYRIEVGTVRQEP